MLAANYAARCAPFFELALVPAFTLPSSARGGAFLQSGRIEPRVRGEPWLAVQSGEH